MSGSRLGEMRSHRQLRNMVGAGAGAGAGESFGLLKNEGDDDDNDDDKDDDEEGEKGDVFFASKLPAPLTTRRERRRAMKLKAFRR